MLKVGLIGCGGIGSLHAECWLAMGGRVKLAAIADITDGKADKFAEKSGAKVYKTGMELIEDADVDIIDICLPTYLHTEHAVKAMEVCKNVFIEKPICLNEREAKLLLDTQAKTGARIQVGQVIRFWDEYVWLKKAIDNNDYGKVVSAGFTRLSENPVWSWNNWYNDPDLSGTMALDLHVHDVDFIRYMMGGEPDRVMSAATRNDKGVIQHIHTIYTYGSAVITSEGCWDLPHGYPFTMIFRAKLEKATVEFDTEGRLTVYLHTGEKFNPELKKAFQAESEAGINVSDLGAYYNELVYFVDTVEGKETAEIAPLSEAIKSAELAWKEIGIAGGKVI